MATTSGFSYMCRRIFLGRSTRPMKRGRQGPSSRMVPLVSPSSSNFPDFCQKLAFSQAQVELMTCCCAGRKLVQFMCCWRPATKNKDALGGGMSQEWQRGGTEEELATICLSYSCCWCPCYRAAAIATCEVSLLLLPCIFHLKFASFSLLIKCLHKKHTCIGFFIFAKCNDALLLPTW